MLPQNSPNQPTIRKTGAFTLVELLVSMAVLAIIMMVSVNVIFQTQKTWTQGSARIEQFREARVAFEAITQSLGQAVLNTYNTYRYKSGGLVPENNQDTPEQYVRHSELQFVCGQAKTLLTSGAASLAPGHAVFFQAPLGVVEREEYEGLRELLCGRGYFVMYGNDDGWRPRHILQQRTRYRLMEYRPTAEANGVYDASVGPDNWFRSAASNLVNSSETTTSRGFTRPAAENIVALIISPRLAGTKESLGKEPTSIAPDYQYDSTKLVNTTTQQPQGTQHLLPPMVTVTLVAIDEVSARRLEDKYGDSIPPLVMDSEFTDTSKYEQDLKEVESRLIQEKLTYRIFSTAVALRNSKWNVEL